MAKINDIAIKVRQRLDDMQKIRVSDPEVICFINDAIDLLSDQLITLNDAEMIENMTINGQSTINRPNLFVRFVGQYPIEFVTESGQVKFKHIDSEFAGILPVRYFAMKQTVYALTDDCPFTKSVHQTELVEKTVGLFAQRYGNSSSASGGG